MSTARARELQAFQQGSEALLGLIRGERGETQTPRDRRRRAEAKLHRTRLLLSAFGDPQHSYPTIHVTGTSGKGSTSTSIASILHAAGYRAGLRTSPYLQVPTEKLQIGPELIDATSFARLVDRVLEVSHRLFPPSGSAHRLGYAETWTALSFLWFAEQGVDLAVIEVGAGGRFDTTNVISPMVSVVTSVGLDHLVSLGPTLADIAWHKAGIIKPGSTVVTGELPTVAKSVIETEARLTGASIRTAAASWPLSLSQPGMAGQFQRGNAQIAATVAGALADCGFVIPDAAIAAGLRAARLPGRLEQMPGESPPAVWIDGAHNEDKIAAVAQEATRLTPRGTRPVVVLGLLQAKDAPAIANILAPVAAAVVATQPTVIGKRSRSAVCLASEIEAHGFSGPLLVEPDPVAATACAGLLARDLETSVLVTGSMYLAGEVRRRWYPDEDIVLERTAWPGSAVGGSSAPGALGRLEGHEPHGEHDNPAEEQILPGIHQEAVWLER